MSACPICTKGIESGTVITCRRCWWLIPTKESIWLSRMHRAGQAMESKLAKVVRIVREKHLEIL